MKPTALFDEMPRGDPAAGSPNPSGGDVEGSRQRNLVELVRRTASGDESALAAFYETTVGYVYGLAKRMLNDAAVAEDVVVEVYAQVWDSASRYDVSRANVLTWLLTITRSRALDKLRKRRREAIVAECAEQLADWQADHATPSGLDLLLAVEVGSRVQQALASLPALDRQLLGLAYFRDLSHRDIATLLRLPLGTIKSRIRRALLALAPMLEPE
jgi:RNA polymerase sigma-70 factor (ECF subfamily)